MLCVHDNARNWLRRRISQYTSASNIKTTGQIKNLNNPPNDNSRTLVGYRLLSNNTRSSIDTARSIKIPAENSNQAGPVKLLFIDMGT